MPLWLDYFITGNFGSKIFALLFISIKLFDISWKLRGAGEAIEMLLTNSLVSNIHELVSSSIYIYGYSDRSLDAIQQRRNMTVVKTALLANTIVQYVLIIQ